MAKFVISYSYKYDGNLGEDINEAFFPILREGYLRLGIALEAAIKRKLSHAGGGKLYRSKAGGGVLHRASAPGEPPAPDLGLYRASWSFSVIGGRLADLQIGLASSLWRVFGRRLELGGWSRTANGGEVYIAPRPHLRPVLNELQAMINKEISGR